MIITKVVLVFVLTNKVIVIFKNNHINIALNITNINYINKIITNILNLIKTLILKLKTTSIILFMFNRLKINITFKLSYLNLLLNNIKNNY